MSAAIMGFPGRPPETELEQAMRVDQAVPRPTDREGQRIGLAWARDSIQARPIVWKDGSTGGFFAEIAFDPERRVGIVMLANRSDFSDITPPGRW